MNGYGADLVLIAALVVVNALLAGSEIALISLRESQLRRLRRKGGRGAARLARLTEDPNRYLATIQIGITLAGFLASATAAVSLAEPLVPLLSFAGGMAQPLAVGLVTVALTFVTLVVGELAPKRLGMQFAERWSLLAARPLDVLATVSRPAVWVLGRTTNFVVRLLGGDPRAGKQPPTPEELRDMVISHRGLTPDQRAIVTRALEIHERSVRTALVPRRSVFALSADTPAGQARGELAGSGHSRAPVFGEGHFDDIAGIVHLRDLTTSDDSVPVGELARQATVFPDVMKISDALLRFRTDHQQFALVTDEHGSVEGIVTIEDLLEEIVGEIYDETDRRAREVERGADGSLLVPGDFPVDDLEGLGVELGDVGGARYTTVAGLVLDTLGRLPSGPGVRCRVDGWDVELVEIDQHAITAVRLRPHNDDDGPGERTADGTGPASAEQDGGSGRGDPPGAGEAPRP
ncbi:hemolysin family protein [Streptomyces sp. NPDC046237]|uniref:hemolysin family protein n=1 Tax=Streptomyces sp. NPDC046237 TaxID=3154914 RepID=UPI0033C6F24D